MVWSRGELSGSIACLGLVSGERNGVQYQSLQCAYEHAVEDLASFVRVANILKGLGGILASNVEQNLLTTSVCSC